MYFSWISCDTLVALRRIVEPFAWQNSSLKVDWNCLLRRNNYWRHGVRCSKTAKWLLVCAVPSPGFARSRDIFSFGWWSSVERISYSALLNLFVELIVDCHRIIKGWKSMVGRKMTYCFDRAGYPSRQACNLSSLTGVDSGRDRAGWWDGFVWWNCSSSFERIFFMKWSLPAGNSAFRRWVLNSIFETLMFEVAARNVFASMKFPPESRWKGLTRSSGARLW